MRLVHIATGDSITLPNDLLWEDEFDWSPVLSDHGYSTTGALFVDMWVRQAGRPISLRAAQDDMGWVPRATVATLNAWSGPTFAGATFRLEFEYPTDTRTFNVIFDCTDGNPPITAVPVAGFPGHRPQDWFRITIKFTEV